MKKKVISKISHEHFKLCPHPCIHVCDELSTFRFNFSLMHVLLKNSSRPFSSNCHKCIFSIGNPYMHSLNLFNLNNILARNTFDSESVAVPSTKQCHSTPSLQQNSVIQHLTCLHMYNATTKAWGEKWSLLPSCLNISHKYGTILWTARRKALKDVTMIFCFLWYSMT